MARLDRSMGYRLEHVAIYLPNVDTFARDLFTVSIIFGEICATHHQPWPNNPIVIHEAK